MPTTADFNNNPDSFFINRVRRMIRDQVVGFQDTPNADAATGAPWLFAGSKAFRVQRSPMFKGFLPLITAPSPISGDSPIGLTYTPIFDPPNYSGVPPAVSAIAGTFPAGTYDFISTQVINGVESLPVGVSGYGVIVLGAAGGFSVAGQAGLPTSVSAVNTYLIGSTVATTVAGRLAQQVPAAGVTTTVNVNNPPVSPKRLPCYYISDTGELTFLAAPTSGPILTNYQASHFSDQQVTDALYEGLYQLFPEIWQWQIDTSILYSPTITEYALPTIFNNPDVEIVSVEMQPPSGILISIETGMWHRPNLSTLVFTRAWPSGSVVRLTYNAPYQALSDLEVELMHAPTYWAAAQLLLEQEASRSRQNDLIALAREGGSQPGNAAQQAQLWLTQFNTVKNTRARVRPSRSMLEQRSVEILTSRREFTWDPV